MENKYLLDLLESVNDEYIFETAPPMEPKRHSFRLPQFVAAASCFILVVTSMIMIAHISTSRSVPSVTEAASNNRVLSDTTDITQANTAVSTDSPPPQALIEGLPLIDQEMSLGEFGFEGILVREAEELENNNPWNSNIQLDKLPIYKNHAFNNYLFAGASVYLDTDKMFEISENVANSIGFRITERYTDTIWKYGSNGPDNYNDDNEERTYMVTAVCDEAIIRVNALGSVSIVFSGSCYIASENKSVSIDNPIELPEGLTPSSIKFTDEELPSILEYINGIYPNLLSLSEPFSASTWEYNYFGERNLFSNLIFDNSDDITKAILNFNFSKYGISAHSFSDSTSADTRINRITLPADLSEYTEKIGDYPIITADEATSMLLSGSYITSVSEYYLMDGLIANEDICKTELVYINTSLCKYLMPYYKFYVRLYWDEETLKLKEERGHDTSLQHYGIYYVPAVEGKYLSEESQAVPYIN